MNTRMLSFLKGLIQRKPTGQGLVETALVFPVLLIVLSGMVEMGFLMNEYLALQDSARNAARFAADGLYYARDTDMDCSTTRDFYRQTACLVNQELAQERPEVSINIGTGYDDIVISAFSILGSGASTVSNRHPDENGENGWSISTDSFGAANQVSRFTSAEVAAKLNAGAPSTGFVLVEVFYEYEHKLKLPWITAFLHDPLGLYVYTFMPLVSAEPTATPMP